MKIIIDKEDNCIVYKRYRELHSCLGIYIPIHNSLIETISGTTLCIAYPKGKRPALPYPQNPSKNEQ